MTREEKIEVIIAFMIREAGKEAKSKGEPFTQEDEDEIVTSFKEDPKVAEIFISIIDECISKSQPQDIVDVITQQDTIIGRLTREAENLKDNQYKLNQWRDQQKKEAGFETNISFDHVWNTVLDKAKKYDQLNVSNPT